VLILWFFDIYILFFRNLPSVLSLVAVKHLVEGMVTVLERQTDITVTVRLSHCCVSQMLRTYLFKYICESTVLVLVLFLSVLGPDLVIYRLGLGALLELCGLVHICQSLLLLVCPNSPPRVMLKW